MNLGTTLKCVLVGLSVVAGPAAARADETPSFDLSVGRVMVEDYTTRRFEPAGLPLVGGNSDAGLQVGGAFTLTRFENGSAPYSWRMSLVAKLAVGGRSGSPSGLSQQSYVAQWDVPDLLGGNVRLLPAISYQRAVDQGYFGLGNASSAIAPNGSTQYFQYLDRELQVRQVVRVNLRPSYDFVIATILRAESPVAYPGTRLAVDAAARGPDGASLLRGIAPGSSSTDTGIGMLASGLIYDSRDSEIFPRSGAFHQIAFRAAEGLPLAQDVRYGGFDATLSWMMPLFHRNVVLAARLVADLEFGDVPFYDLYRGGAFQTDAMLGGPTGIRGVPSGRYLGRIKAMGNVELRTLPIEFHLFHESFHLGADLLFDTGRLWLDYSFRSPLDGSGLGLKYGAGGGLYALWGQAALFRVDAAYSPDQVAQSHGFPVGIYVEQGVMF